MTPPPAPRGLLAALTASALAFGLLLLAVLARWAPLATLDRTVDDGLHGVALRDSLLVLAMKMVSGLGTTIAYVVLLVLLVVLLVRRGLRRAAVFSVVAMVVGTVVNGAVKAAVERPRPVFARAVGHAGHSSFPSGHANSVTVACGILLLVVLPQLRPAARRPVAVLGVAWVALMDFSRLALGVHYLSDVLAGDALGASCLLLCWLAFGRTRPPAAVQAAPVPVAASTGGAAP